MTGKTKWISKARLNDPDRLHWVIFTACIYASLVFSIFRSFSNLIKGLNVMIVYQKEDWNAPLEVVLEDEGFDPGDTLDRSVDSLVLKRLYLFIFLFVFFLAKFRVICIFMARMFMQKPGSIDRVCHDSRPNTHEIFF